MIARAKRISSDLVKFSKKCSPLKRIHLPLILFSGSQSCSLDPHAFTICRGSVSKNTSHFTSYPLSFEYEGLPSSQYKCPTVKLNKTCFGSLYPILTSFQTFLWVFLQRLICVIPQTENLIVFSLNITQAVSSHSFRWPLTLTHSCRRLPLTTLILCC